MPLHPSARSWEIMREQVDVLKVIGKGAFSQVAKATVENIRGYQDCITVAVKMLKGVMLVCEFSISLSTACISPFLLFNSALMRKGFAYIKSSRA